jgi:hypothetical protein
MLSGKVQKQALDLVVSKEVNRKIRNNVSQEQVIKKPIIHDNCFTRKEYIPKLLSKGYDNAPCQVLWHPIYRVKRLFLSALLRGQHVR